MAGSGHGAPRFEEGPNWFKVTLHTRRRNFKGEHPDPEATVMGLLEGEAKITSAAVMKALGVSKATAVSHIEKLIAAGRLVREGNGPMTAYRTVGR
jgi:predicted ArsR family transcriptional regulator